MSQQLQTSQKVDELLKFISALPTSSQASSSERKCSDEQERFYITTAINYTNGRPHIGHAYEAVTSDVIARYHRIYGRDVFFLTGTDEHGQKVANTAASKGFKPKKFCDENVAVFKELNQKLQISNDRFIRTTDADHHALASRMFQTAHANGDIYKAQYEGYYDERNENFLTDLQAEATDCKDPVTGTPFKKQSEETYFFRMGKYQKRLLAHLQKHPQSIEPERARAFILQKLQNEELRDLCVSRSTFKWGIPVPIDTAHVIYVWFDALSNYLTGIRYFDEDDAGNLRRFWPANVHVIGKDIKWFHCVIWPCILMSCGIELPKKVFSHGFVVDENGEKMSKSVGNVVDPFDVLKRHSSDSVRYFICTQTRFGNDMKWKEQDLKERHDAHLAHIYGNLVSRALGLCRKFCGGVVPSTPGYEDVLDLKALITATEAAYSELDLFTAAELAMDALRECNEWLHTKEPWNPKVAADEKAKIIRSVLECVYVLSHFMEPFCPSSSARIFKSLDTPRSTIRTLRSCHNLESGTKVVPGEKLFRQHSSKHQRRLQRT